MNYVVIVGKLKEIEKVSKGKLNLVVAVPQSFKNKGGKYDVDLIDCEVIGGIVDTTNDYCKIDSTIGIKGRLKIDYYNKDDEVIKIMKVSAEKISFLKSDNQ